MCLKSLLKDKITSDFCMYIDSSEFPCISASALETRVENIPNVFDGHFVLFIQGK